MNRIAIPVEVNPEIPQTPRPKPSKSRRLATPPASLFRVFRGSSLKGSSNADFPSGAKAWKGLRA